MIHFKIIGWFWLVFGGLGLLYSCFQLAAFADLIFLPGERGALVPVAIGFAFTLPSALAGFGLLRHWQLARILIEILASILFTCCAILFIFAEVGFVYGLAAAVSLYSLLVALFVKYESPPNTTLEPTATAP